MTNSLSKTGLSMTQAQSISNLCNQKALFINSSLNNVNNVKKVFAHGGETFTYQEGLPLPINVLALLEEKSSLHALQAFLMENIKAKDALIKGIKDELCEFPQAPLRQPFKGYTAEYIVDESWGWKQLTSDEYNDYLINESYASHIGQYIHNGGTLDSLRKSYTKDINFQTVELTKDIKTPLKIIPNHSEEILFELHMQLANVHRTHEQQVNYYKAKVKNLVTNENAEIANRNAKMTSEVNSENQMIQENYGKEYKMWSDNNVTLSHVFEEKRMKEIKEASSLRIKIPSSLQSVVDIFKKDIEEVK